jgi:hypothetical protein
MFHVGNARSALYNWVVARQSGGVMVLRIEDTDAERSRPEWTEGILEAMAWLGMGPQEYERIAGFTGSGWGDFSGGSVNRQPNPSSPPLRPWKGRLNDRPPRCSRHRGRR